MIAGRKLAAGEIPTPLHDWTRVDVGIFLSFHGAWITHLTESFNQGGLPHTFYAASTAEGDEGGSAPAGDIAFYLAKRRTLVIRHVTGDRIVALFEIVSPANKHNRVAVADFVEKVLAALRDGINVVVIDPFSPGRHDP